MSIASAPPAGIVDDRDWSRLTLGQRIQQLEVEGYVQLPEQLSAQQIARLKQITSQLETKHADYSERQRTRREIHFDHPELAELIAQPQVLEFLGEVLGPDIIFLESVYARSEPGHPGISLHTDGQTYGSQIFGYAGSCPVQVRVLYYLDDLTPEVSPFLVVPRSHLSLHADANPYRRYLSHPQQVMVTAQAGSAVLLNHRCFHGNYPNNGERAREMLAYLYRPGWAGPTVQEIPPWDEAKLALLPAHIRRFFEDRNVRRGFDFHHGNKPPNMASEAPGINPDRWERLD